MNCSPSLKIKGRQKILFYEPAKSVGNKGVGGSLVSLLQIVQTLDLDRYEPYIAITDEFDIIDQYKRCGCKIVKINSADEYAKTSTTILPNEKNFLAYPVYPVFIKEIMALLRSIPKVIPIIKIINTENIDIIHCNCGYGTNIEGVLAAIITGKPCICHSRSFYSGRFSPILKMVEKGVKAHIVISTAVKERLINNGIDERKILLIHNWINTKKTLPLQTEVAALERGGVFNIASIGRIIPWKGQHLLVELGRELKRLHIKFKIHVFGDAPSGSGNQYLQHLKNATAENGLREEILFLGYQDYEAIHRRRFHVLVHTSTAPEPFGRVIIEAMYNHIPILATRSGGVLDIVEEDKNGLLFDPLSSGEITAKTLRLWQDTDLRSSLAENAFQTVMRKFSEKDRMSLLSNLYERISMKSVLGP